MKTAYRTSSADLFVRVLDTVVRVGRKRNTHNTGLRIIDYVAYEVWRRALNVRPDETRRGAEKRDSRRTPSFGPENIRWRPCARHLSPLPAIRETERETGPQSEERLITWVSTGVFRFERGGLVQGLVGPSFGRSQNLSRNVVRIVVQTVGRQIRKKSHAVQSHCRKQVYITRPGR